MNVQEKEKQRNMRKLWFGKWIECPWCGENTAPEFLGEFLLDRIPGGAVLEISGLGFYSARLNGVRVGDALLQPAFSNYTKSVYYNRYPVSALLKEGRNILEVTVGNGWFHEPGEDSFDFEHASWKMRPVLLCQLLTKEKVLLASGKDWKCRGSRWVFNSLRLGVSYDASREEEEYLPAVIAKGPGGQLKEQTIPPIRIEEYLQPKRVLGRVYDFGKNMAGDVRITVSGEKGSKLAVIYGERLNEDGKIDQRWIKRHPEIPRIQVDEYTLSGAGPEVFQSDFTYKGFRYAEVRGECRIENVTARSFHTYVKERGGFQCSDSRVNRIMEAVRNSTLSNLHHTITDCPHREKNGWLGDAHASCEQALLQFDMEKIYRHYLDAVADCQWPSGQLPCIAPTSVYGYNFQSGPTWDGALFRIPWALYVYTGKTGWLKRWYPAMKKYMDYLPWICDEKGICESGLGDFLPMEGVPVCPDGMMLTGHLKEIQQLMSQISCALGKYREAEIYKEQAESARKALRREYGVRQDRNISYLASALHFDLAGSKAEAKRWAAELAALLGENQYRAGTGIFSSVYMLEELTRYGYFSEALRTALQPECPGWVYMTKQGGATLWEHWDGKRGSLNHHMRSGIAKWFYQALAGISLEGVQPGFRHLVLKPNFTEEIEWVTVWLESPKGRIEICRQGDEYRLKLPEGIGATVLIGRQRYEAEGECRFRNNL